MKLKSYQILIVLAFLIIVDPVLAQEAAQPELSFGERMFRMLPMFMMVFFIFYFLVIRPQNKQEQEQRSLLGSLKKGDQLVTSGGILGKYNSHDQEFVTLDIGSNTKLKVEAAHIVRRIEKSSSNNSKVADKKKK